LRASINSYVRFLRNNHQLDPEEHDYQKSRATRMHALAQIEQLKLKRVRGQLHFAEDVEFVMTSMLTAFKSRMLALPSRVSPRLVGKTNIGEINELIRIEVYSALEELSNYDQNAFTAANEVYLASIGAARPEAEGAGGNGEEPA
jgi:hypothetical protein